MNKLQLTVIALALAAPTMVQAAGGVAGSPHDLSTNSVWNTRKGVCSPCHTAHNTDPAQAAPLWSHKSSSGTFIPYTSPTMDSVMGSPGGPSLACLSCHDGTVAINELISGTQGTSLVYIDPGAKVGPDLHTSHPVSIDYGPGHADVARGKLENPMTYKIGDPKPTLTVSVAPVPATWSGASLTGQTINEALLFGGKMECSSCHDVHKQVGSSPTSGILVKISSTDSTGRGDTLCRTCHIH
ncbi:MAG: hypothetical protein HZA90_26690 [Verrucomicrobia bacterium]|nr:hypothetical protein [Verrucomicrobiota bacterium]